MSRARSGSVATHLGLSIHERHAQAHALVDLVQPTRTFVLGDFNDWFWVRSVRGVLAQTCPVRTRLRTFPALFPLMRLDRIYVSRDGRSARPGPIARRAYIRTIFR